MPGLEVKYALEEATKLNSVIVFLGYEMNEFTLSRFYHESRSTVSKTLYKYFTQDNSRYQVEMSEFISQLHTYGLKKFIESSCDQYFINWYIICDDFFLGLFKY